MRGSKPNPGPTVRSSRGIPHNGNGTPPGSSRRSAASPPPGRVAFASSRLNVASRRQPGGRSLDRPPRKSRPLRCRSFAALARPAYRFAPRPLPPGNTATTNPSAATCSASLGQFTLGRPGWRPSFAELPVGRTSAPRLAPGHSPEQRQFTAKARVSSGHLRRPGRAFRKRAMQLTAAVLRRQDPIKAATVHPPWNTRFSIPDQETPRVSLCAKLARGRPHRKRSVHKFRPARGSSSTRPKWFRRQPRCRRL